MRMRLRRLLLLALVVVLTALAVGILAKLGVELWREFRPGRR
jgi:hypothetical protein